MATDCQLAREPLRCAQQWPATGCYRGVIQYKENSMPTDNKATSKHLLELWGDNALHKSDDYLAANYVNHQLPDAAGGTPDKSAEQWKALVAEFHKGFSNVKMEVLLQVAQGDYVCSRWRMTAKHTGTFANLAATGKTSTWTGVHTDLYKGDKLVESWVDWDKYSFLDGLGLVS
jgi:predicted ester cyclase